MSRPSSRMPGTPSTVAALWLRRAVRTAREGQAPPKYLGLFLSPGSRREILERFPPKHQGLRTDHVTLLFGPDEEQFAEFQEKHPLGERHEFKVVGYAEDDRGQAVVVELPEGFARPKHGEPHVTISVAPGTSAVYSNELVERGYEKVEPFTVKGVVDVPEGDRGRAKARAEKKRREAWEEFLRGETRNPEYGRDGHHKEHVQRKTLYDAGGPGRRQVLQEWSSYLGQKGRSAAAGTVSP